MDLARVYGRHELGHPRSPPRRGAAGTDCACQVRHTLNITDVSVMLLVLTLCVSLSLSSWYIVGLPMSAILCFYFELGLVGMWIGLLCGPTSNVMVFSIILVRTNWDKQYIHIRS